MVFKMKNKKSIGLKELSIITTAIGVIIIYFNFTYFSQYSNIFTTLNLLSAIIIAGIPILYRYMEYNKIKKIESAFPRFLRDVTENISIGMTLPQSIRAATENDYGVLSPHIKDMSAKISWGISFEKVLIDFAKKIRSKTMNRTVQTIIETHRSGGTIDTVLRSVVDSINQLERIKKERSSSIYAQMVSGYMIYLVFLGVMIGMSSFLLPAFSFEETMPDMQPMFLELFRSLIVIQGLFAGLAIGKMAEGTIFAGIKHSLVLVVFGYSAFVIFG